MSNENNEIVAIDGWGVHPGSPEVVRFLEGPQRRLSELARANWRYTAGHAIDWFFLHHRDSSLTPIVGASVRASREDDSDAKLWWGGLRASGKDPFDGIGELSYWADLALVQPVVKVENEVGNRGDEDRQEEEIV